MPVDVEEKKETYLKSCGSKIRANALKAAHICRKNLKFNDRIVEMGRTEVRTLDGEFRDLESVGKEIGLRDGEFPVDILRAG